MYIYTYVCPFTHALPFLFRRWRAARVKGALQLLSNRSK